MIISNTTFDLLQSALKPLGQGDGRALFTQGDIVDGKVIKAMGPRQMMVLVGGQKLIAQTTEPMVVGQRFLGRVESTELPLKITLLSGQNAKHEKIAEMVRSLLPGRRPLGESLSNIVQQADKPALPPASALVVKQLGAQLESALPKGLADMTPHTAKEAIKNSGLFLESTLRQVATARKGEAVEVGKQITVDLKALLGKTLTVVNKDTVTLAQQIERELVRIQNPSGAERGERVTQERGEKTNPPMVGTKNSRHKIIHTAVGKEFSVGGKTNSGAKTVTNPLIENGLADLERLREVGRDLKLSLNEIELNQLVNAAADKSRPGAATPMTLYQIPFIEGMAVERARVYLNPEREGEGVVRSQKKGERSIVFMLELTKLGPVRADILVGDGTARGVVYAASDAVAAHLREMLPELVEPLAADGYRVDFEIKKAGEEFLTKELETPGITLPQGLISVKA